MLRYSTRAKSLFAYIASFCFLGSLEGCDPHELQPADENGPPFLIVAPSAEQPTSASGGTSLYVQARGGDSIGILSHGCNHAYGALPDRATTSCAALSGAAPFTFFVFPNVGECVVEVRLYSSCDTGGIGANTVPLATCESQEMFVTSMSLPVAGSGPIDSGLDAVDGAGDE